MKLYQYSFKGPLFTHQGSSTFSIAATATEPKTDLKHMLFVNVVSCITSRCNVRLTTLSYDLVTKFPLFKNNSTGLPCSPITDGVTEDVDVGVGPKRNITILKNKSD